MNDSNSSTAESSLMDKHQVSGSAPIIRIQGLRKAYGNDVLAVRHFSLDVAENEIVALLGPSGCGKTTTLRCVAGLLDADDGHIEVDSKVVFSSRQGISLPPERRGLSMVFQQYALWPHMNVFENVAFGLRIREASKSDIERMTKDALRQVQLWDKHDRRISELSGGQQQRIALARAIAFHPRVVLFDEPLSNLDAKLREEMRFELIEIQRRLGFTAIYVTHDQNEAISLASRIVVMNHGVIEQVDTPRDIWSRPASGFVARFIGSTNRFEGRVTRADEGTFLVETRGGLEVTIEKHRYSGEPREPTEGQSVEFFVKMGDIHLTDAAPAGHENAWEAILELVSFNGDATLVRFPLGETNVMARGSSETKMREGDRVVATIDPGSFVCFPLAAQDRV